MDIVLKAFPESLGSLFWNLLHSWDANGVQNQDIDGKLLLLQVIPQLLDPFSDMNIAHTPSHSSTWVLLVALRHGIVEYISTTAKKYHLGCTSDAAVA